jgi:YD repeat-containing protein
LQAAPAVATTAPNLTTASASVTTRQFTTGGLLLLETDPNGNSTQYTYGQVKERPDDSSRDCPLSFVNLYPTLVNAPEGRIRQLYYDCAAGAQNDVVEASNHSLRTRYDYDRYSRNTSSVTGYGLAADNSHTTSTQYDDVNWQVRVVEDNALGHVSHFNQIGELFLDRQNSHDATVPISAASTQDIRTVTVERTVSPADATASVPAGQYTLTSNPFLSTGSTTEPTLGWTLQYADTSGRLSDVYHYKGADKPAPFGTSSTANVTGHEHYSTIGDTTTITDAAGHPRSMQVDALGRTLSATEGGVSGATYGYDARDNLNSVTQSDTGNYGSPKTQIRSFTYSSLGRLVSATNPETDAPTTYTYYPNGTLKTRTDARRGDGVLYPDRRIESRVEEGLQRHRAGDGLGPILL